MIHSLALSLVLSSLLAAHVWSPNPKDDVIVKQGHRVIVVESYDQDGHPNTKVSISPPQDSSSSAGFVGTAEDRVKQGASLTKEKLKDAYEKASEVAHGAEETVENAFETAREKAHGAKEFAGDAYGKATEAAHGAKEVVESAYEKATEKAHRGKEFVGDAYDKATDKATEKAHVAKEAVKDAYDKTKDFARHKARDAKETVSNQVKDTAKTTKDLRATTRILQGLKDLGSWLDPVFGVTNLLGLAIAYGTGIWVTFISSHVLGGSLPRHQFGLVQSKMYPMYFRAMGSSILMTLLGHIGGHRERLFSESKAERLQVYNLLASLTAVLINALYLEPLATKAMMEKFRLEKEEGRGREMQAPERGGAEGAATVETAIARAREAEQQEQRKLRERMETMKQRLKKLNSYSSLLNILTLAGLSWHLAHLGHCVHRTN